MSTPRSRILGLVAACALGVSLTGCVAYEDGYAPGYAGGGYYGGGGYYASSGVSIYRPAYYGGGYRDHDRDEHRSYYRGGEQRGGWNGGHRDYDGGRTEAWRRRPDNHSYTGG